MIKEIRKKNRTIPIIIFSAFEDTQYFLDAIKVGIEGYILKPANLEQTTEVIMKVIKRFSKIEKKLSVIKIDEVFTWNRQANKLFKNGSEIKLTKNESKLFSLFMNSPDTLFETSEIENYVYDDYDLKNKRVVNLISRLKKKLDNSLIETVYGCGYKIAISEKSNG